MRSGFINKRCPKCNGNVYLDRDHHGWYEHCIQCGYTRDLKIMVKVTQDIAASNISINEQTVRER